MENKKIIYGRIGVIVGIFILMASNVLAFAVSARYHEGNPLFLEPGNSQEIKYTLQNLGGADDVYIQASIISGDVIKPIDSSDIYTIPAGGKATVNYIVEVPDNAEVKDKYHVDVRFTTVTPNSPGSFTLGSSIMQRFDVIVGEGWSVYEEKPINWSLLLLIGIFAVIALVVVILIIKGTKKKK